MDSQGNHEKQLSENYLTKFPHNVRRAECVCVCVCVVIRQHVSVCKCLKMSSWLFAFQIAYLYVRFSRRSALTVDLLVCVHSFA